MCCNLLRLLFFTFIIIDSVFCEEAGLLLNLHRVVNFTLMSRLSFDDLQLTRSLVAANAKITLQTGYFQVICPVLVSFVLLMTLLSSDRNESHEEGQGLLC